MNLSHVDVILAEVGAIEDHVFAMRHQTELRNKSRREEQKARKKQANGRNPNAPPVISASQPKPMVVGRAARILEKQQAKEQPLKKKGDTKIKSSHMQSKDNLQAALAMKESLGGMKSDKDTDERPAADDFNVEMEGEERTEAAMVPSVKDEVNDVAVKSEPEEEVNSTLDGKKRKLEDVDEMNGSGVGVVGDAEDEFGGDDDDDDEDDDDVDKVDSIPEDVSPEVAAAFKERVKSVQEKKLDEYAKNIEDKVRLHEIGWKDRYYSDKCKADDVANHGGREHLFRSYVMGLCWVMKYYYDGCPSWTWYYPFHYAPFASDLRNIERFQKDVKSLDPSTPFYPVEQLMAVLPSDSCHAIPKAAQWLMLDPESPIIDFYPKEVPVDPNGKAMPWLWVVLLPFIDEDRLLAAM